MDFFLQFFCVAFAIILFPLSCFLLVKQQTRASGAATALCFVLMFFAFASLSKFKHVKGLGFEAEMWSDKQEEAAKLISKLKSLTLLTTRQMAIQATQAGLIIDGPSAEGLDQLLHETGQMLGDVGASPEQAKPVTAIIEDGIKAVYLSQELRLLTTELQRALQTLRERNALHPDDSSILKDLQDLEVLMSGVDKLKGESWRSPELMHQVVELADKSHVISEESRKKLKVIDEDLAYFIRNNTVRH